MAFLSKFCISCFKSGVKFIFSGEKAHKISEAYLLSQKIIIKICALFPKDNFIQTSLLIQDFWIEGQKLIFIEFYVWLLFRALVPNGFLITFNSQTTPSQRFRFSWALERPKCKRLECSLKLRSILTSKNSKKKFDPI